MLNDNRTVKPNLIIEELYKVFDKLNEKFYEGKLEKPFISVYTSKLKTTLAYFNANKWWNLKQYEIIITGLAFKNNPISIFATLLHEMVHYYCTVNGITDTTESGRHTALFKDNCLDVWLDATTSASARHKGYAFTQTTPQLFKYLESLEGEIDFELFRNIYNSHELDTEKKEVKFKRFRYICEGCGARFTSDQDYTVVCNKCDKQLEQINVEDEKLLKAKEEDEK